MILILLMFSVLAAAENGSQCTHSTSEFQCVRYIKNYDGDTITFKIPEVHPLFGDNISVRVKGIDTAEIRTKDKCEKEKGRNARKMVEALLKRAKRIDLKNIERGKYFRVVADVIADGKNVADVLLKNNLARRYDGGKKSTASWCDGNGGRVPATPSSSSRKQSR